MRQTECLTTTWSRSSILQLCRCWYLWAAAVNYQSFGDGNYFGPITVRHQTLRANHIPDWCCGRAPPPKKRVRRCGASSSLAGESSVERVLDGGGVPLMRERAGERRDYFSTHWRIITFIYWTLINTRAGFLRLLCAVSWAARPGCFQWGCEWLATVTVS